MIKKITLFLFLSLSIIHTSSSQIRVGDYKFKQDSSAYIPLGSTAKLIDSATVSNFLDDETFSLPQGSIPFWFKFGNDSFNYCQVTDNGLMTFGSTAPGSNNFTPLSSTIGYNGAIAPVGRDLIAVSDTLSRGTLYWDTIGTAPNRIFIVEWRNFSNYSLSRINYYKWNFQIQLHENGNKVKIIYDDFNQMKGNPTNSLTTQVGLRGPSNNFGNLDINNRLLANTSGASWNQTGFGNANNSTCALANNPLILPTQGLTFTYEPPTCLNPDSFRLISVGAQDASFELKRRGNETSWLVTIDTSATFTGSPRRVIFTDSMKQITGLMSSTRYYVTIQSLCGNNDTADTRAPLTFITQCLPVTTLPFIENFENLSAYGNGRLPDCWNYTGTRSNTDTLNLSFNRSPRGGKGYLYFSWNTNDWVFLPQVEMKKGNVYALSFYYKTDDVANWDTLKTMIGKGQAPNLMTSLTGTPVTNFRDTAYRLYTAYYTPQDTGNYTFGIHVRSGTAPYYLSIDDIRIDTISSCITPQALRVDSLSNSRSILTWNEPGLASQWEIEFMPSGQTFGTGNRSFTSRNMLKIDTLSGLNSYQFYVRSICGPQDSSAWAGPFSFTTLCDPVTQLPWTEGFENMTTFGVGVMPGCWTSNGNWASNNSSNTYNRAARTGNNYLTARWSANDWLFTQGFDLKKNKRYRFEFNYVADGFSGWDSLIVYFSSEQKPENVNLQHKIGQGIYNPSNTSYELFSETFEVPSDDIFYLALYLRANGTPWYLSFDDFSLVEVNDIDLETVAIVTKTFGCGNDSAELAAVVKNNGFIKAKNFNVQAQITGAISQNFSLQYTDSLDFEQIDTIMLGYYNNLEGGVYQIRANVAINNDKINQNDTTYLSYNKSFVPNTPQLSVDTICENGIGTILISGNAKSYSVFNENGSFIKDVDSSFSAQLGSSQKFKVVGKVFSKDSVGIKQPLNNASNIGNGNGLVFSVNNATVKINTVDIYYQSSANGHIEISIQDSFGTVLMRHRDTIASGFNNYNPISNAATIPVNFALNPSNYYKMVLQSSSGLSNLQVNNNALFPFTSSQYNNINIRSGISGNNANNNYYYFHNWDVTINECVSDTSESHIHVVQNPIIDILTDTVCVGNISKIKDRSVGQQIINYSLDYGINNTIDLSWTNGDTSFLFGFPGNNFYKIKATNIYGCESEKVSFAFVRPLPNVRIQAQEICEGQQAELEAFGAQTYSWDDQSTNPIRLDYPKSSQTYIVNGTDAFGCKNADTFTLIVRPIPFVFLGNDTSICDNVNFNLELGSNNGGKYYRWQNNSVNKILNATTFGTYHVLVSDDFNCENKDSITISPLQVPLFNLGNDTAFCSNTQFQLTFNIEHPDATEYLWSNGNQTPLDSFTNSGLIGATIQYANGCINSDSLSITVYDAPIINLGNDTSYCAGSPFNLTLNARNPGAIYEWNDQSSNQTLDITHAGLFWVKVLDQWGCTNSDSLLIIENKLPAPSLGPNLFVNPDLPVNVTLSLNEIFEAYLWNNNTTSATLNVMDTGVFWVSVTDKNGCNNSDSIGVFYWNENLHTTLLSNFTFKMYPNPASKFITLDCNCSNYSISIYNLNGQVVLSKINLSKLNEINIESLTDGVYYLKMTDSITGIVKNLSFIVQN